MFRGDNLYNVYAVAKRVISLVLVVLLFMTGCANRTTDALKGRYPFMRMPDAKRLSSEMSVEWRQATAQLLMISWMDGPEGAGYVEVPVAVPGEPTSEKLYTSAWTAALLRQAGLEPSARTVAAMHDWLEKLVRANFTYDNGFPTLYNLYLYHLLQTSLGQPVDREASLRTLARLRRPDGLYAWERGGKTELPATQIATELLVALDVGPELLAPTREAVLKLLGDPQWQEIQDPKEAILEVGGPLLLSAHNLGLPLNARAREFVAEWNRRLQNATSTDPVMVEILLQLARLNQVIGQRLTLPSEYLGELQSLRTATGGFSLQPGLPLEPQYTYKVQQLLQMAANIPPRPEAARHADSRFWGDSWVPYRLTQPNVIDTYHGLVVARLLEEAVPDEAAVADFLSARLQAITASQPGDDEMARAAQELNYALRARELLSKPFPLPESVTSWVATSLNRSISAETVDLSTLSFLVEAAAYLGVPVDRKSIEAAIQKALYSEDSVLDVATMLTRIARALDLPADTFRQHPAVKNALSLTPIGGGYKAFGGAPSPDLLSTFKAVEVLQFFAPDQAAAVLPAVRQFVRTLQNPNGGFQMAPDESPMLRSTAEGLLLLCM